MSDKTAYYDVQDELGRLDTIKQAKGERLRELELQRLERATLALWPRIQKGEPAAVMAWVRLSERKSRLMGLDADPQAQEGASIVQVQIINEMREAPPRVIDGVPTFPP